MSVYDRAPRKVGSYKVGSTGDAVGPGSYDSGYSKKGRNDGYAPFMSLTSRDNFLTPNDTILAAPGPGQYDLNFPYQKPSGGAAASMTAKAKRFSEKVERTPGPGSYALKTHWNKPVHRQAGSAPASLEKATPAVQKVKFHRQTIPPSIPTPGQAFGFEENDDGTLRKQDPPEKDYTMGPAYYNVRHVDPIPTRMYKGIHWGRQRTRRMDFRGKDGPGPGEYEPFSAPATGAVHQHLAEEEEIRPESKVPRYHEAIVKETEKKGIPPPTKYDIKGQFDPAPPKANLEGIEIEKPPFMAQSRRFGKDKVTIPGPGSYNDPRSALSSVKRPTGMKQSPFGQTSVRFASDRQKKVLPGPGSYNAPGMASESMRKAYMESTRRGVFGTTSMRVQAGVKKESGELPGPADYQPKEKPTLRYKYNPSSNFVSQSHRLHEPPPIVKEIPAPGSYDVDSSYKVSQGRCLPAPGRTEEAQKNRSSFQSSSSRFAPPRDVVLAEVDPSLPAPNAYVPNLRGKENNPLVNKDPRWKETKTLAPGPGAYEFSPLIQDTILKGTFNVSLNSAAETAIARNTPNKLNFVIGV